MKRFALFPLLILIAACITGCGMDAKDYSDTTLVFGKNGSVTDVIVEKFDKDYYSQDGLTTFFNEAISDFLVNEGNGTVLLTSIDVNDGTAKAIIDFDKADTYSRFYDTVLFYGTINDAYDAGYSMDVTLKELDASNTIGKAELMAMSKSNIIITDEPVCIKTNEKIKYASANIEVVNDKYVRVSSDSSGLAYLILE